MEKKQSHFIFRKQDLIGINDAEDDKKYLLKCFVDTGDLEAVLDFSNPRCLVLGRTGVGKTALLTKLQDQNKKRKNVIVINPEATAMHHISNSTIIRYMHELGIDLNTFFKLLWRHAICVEIFNHHFKITKEDETENLIDRLKCKFKKTNPHHFRALNYLLEWKDTFWKTSDDHVTGMISKKESELDNTLSASASSFKLGLSGKNKLTNEEARQIKQRAQLIVDEVQMKEVTDLLSMLNEVVEDQQKQYYLVIDKLDEGWVDDELRYRLIKALIETVRDINRFDNIKPLVALRADLLGHVFELTKDTGFQEEKYSSLYMHVRWTKSQLTEMIDKRLSLLLKDRYKKSEVTHQDILPQHVEGIDAMEYILDRTLLRPRDVIEFFNILIKEAVEVESVTENMVKKALRLYSRERLDSLYYEWTADYPKLKQWVKLLREKGTDFFCGSIDLKKIENLCVEYALENPLAASKDIDYLYHLSFEVGEGRLDPADFLSNLIHIFYKVGLVGVRIKGDTEPSWSYEINKKITVDDIDKQTMVFVHPCFRSALNII